MVFCMISLEGHSDQRHQFNTSYILDNYILQNSTGDYKNRTLGSLLVSSDYRKDFFEVSLSVLATHSNGSPTLFLGDSQIISNIDVEGKRGLKFMK